MVGEKLERGGDYDWTKRIAALGDVDDVVAMFRDFRVAESRDAEHDAAAGADFLDVRQDFFVYRALRGDADHWDAVGDKSDGAVLHFARAVSFGVDVADLLEFQRPFERAGQIVSAAHIEGALRVPVAGVFGAPDDVVLIVEAPLQFAWDLPEAFN